MNAYIDAVPLSLVRSLLLILVFSFIFQPSDVDTESSGDHLPKPLRQSFSVLDASFSGLDYHSEDVFILSASILGVNAQGI
jgi:hypothetical protein